MELANNHAGMESNQDSYNAAWRHGYAAALKDVSEQLERQQNLRAEENELIAKTAFGDITAGVKSDPNYPGIYIDLKGSNLNAKFETDRVSLAWVEFSPDKHKLQTIVYGDGEMDDYTHLIEHENLLSRERSKSDLASQIASANFRSNTPNSAPKSPKINPGPER